MTRESKEKEENEKAVDMLEEPNTIRETSVKLSYDYGGIPYLEVEFVMNGKKGSFKYNFYGDESITDTEFDENDNENIYDAIDEWVEENVEFTSSVKVRGKVL